MADNSDRIKVTHVAPAPPHDGEFYYDPISNQLFIWNGSQWIAIQGNAGMTNPMITQDDIIVGGSGGSAGRLAKGLSGNVLTVDAITGHIAWDAPTGGMTNPMTTVNDMIIGGTNGAPARLAKGASGSVLTVDPTSGNLAWDSGDLAGQFQTIAFSASITPNCNSGHIMNIGALTGNITVNAPTNPSTGQIIVFVFTQDGSGGRTVTWNAVFKTSWTAAPGASQISTISFVYDGTNWQQLAASVLSNTGAGNFPGSVAIKSGDLTARFKTQSIAYSASITPDISLGQIISVGTLTGDVTINNPSNLLTPGQFVVFGFLQDGVGGHNVTWGTVFQNAPAPASGVSAGTYVAFISDGSGNLWALSSGSSGGAGVSSVTAGTNVTITGTAQNPIINAAESGLLIPAHSPFSPFSTGVGTDPTYNFIAETLPRVPGLSSANSAPFTGQGGAIAFYAITLLQGTTITHIAFEIGTQNLVFGSGGAGPHSWACLYDGNGNALAVSSDVVTVSGANWSGTNTLQIFNIDRLYSSGWGASGSTSYTIPTGKSGIYYIGLMVYLGSASGTIPQFVGGAANGALSLYRPAYAFQDQAATYGANTTAPATVTPVTEVGGMLWGGIA